MKFPFYKQLDSKDCGIACLKMIAKWHGKVIDSLQLKSYSFVDNQGISLSQLSKLSEEIGLKSYAVKLNIEDLYKEITLPCIVFWKQNHFVVLFKVEYKSKFIFFKSTELKFIIGDPAHGLVELSNEEFKNHFSLFEKDKGIVLILETTPKFHNSEFKINSNSSLLSFIKPYYDPYNRYIVQILIGLLIGCILNFAFPFLTQSIVDIGIRFNNLNFIHLILLANIMLFSSQIIIELIRNRLLFFISSRVNISIVSDFFIKLMKLPINFFDTKLIGDIIQRLSDHKRIQLIMSESIFLLIFSGINLIVFGIILAIYSLKIFFVFFIGSVIYCIWIIVFLSARKKLDYLKFHQNGLSQSNLIQTIQGMQEIKLHNSEQSFRWKWESFRIAGYKLDLKSLYLDSTITTGVSFINQIKNLLISYYTAKLVIDGKITFGVMLSIQYIIGQLNAPISQIMGFIQQLQDAKISLERLNEIHQKPSEENPNEQKSSDIPKYGDIQFSKVNFSYDGSEIEVLKNLNFTIPFGKTTAIVGSSGSGKTTLLKLIMKFYDPKNGVIMIGKSDLKNLKSYDWREYFGAVLQDGFIFSDTIAQNIAVKDNNINKEKLLQSVKMANILEYIEELPLRFNTKIGQDGIGLSMGQRQRLLIARAVYKEPMLLLFDEATNSLDTTNERKIVENINTFLQNRTAVIVAHRLSTVKDADNIIVLDRGEIVEQGTHDYLTSLRGVYYTLVKNQLELGQ